MRVDNRVTIAFDEKDLKTLIKEKVESEGYDVVDIKINLKNKKWTEGHGMFEIDYEKLVLENVEVLATKKVCQ